MTVTVHDPRPVYDAIVARLVSETGEEVGEAQRPEGATPPYSVVYPLPDRATFGTLTDANQISLQLFQVSCVGATMDEAQAMQTKVRAALLGWAPTVAGFTPNRIELDLGSGVRRDDKGVVFITTDRFSMYVD